MGFTQSVSFEAQSHIGGLLRAVRDSRGESLEAAGKALHIQARYLRAIEALDKDALPSLGYAVGYVRSYAVHLGLDPKDAVARFKTEIECPQSKGISGNPHHVSKRKIRLPQGSFAAAAVLSCAAVIVSWYGWKSDGNAAPARAVNPAIEDTALPAKAEQAPLAATKNQAVFAAITPKQNDPDAISLKATGPSWVHVTDKDGLVLLSRVMVPGEIFETNRSRRAVVNVRDAGALELFIGGVSQGPLGEKGESLKALPLHPNSAVSEQ